MNRIENGIHTTNGLSTETHKSFPIQYGLWGEKCLKSFLTYLDCTKCNEIYMHYFRYKNDIKSTAYVYRITQKFSDTSYPTGENF